MYEAPSFDIKIRQGNTTLLVFRFKTVADAPIDLTGSELIFRATGTLSGSLRKTTADASLAMLDPASGEVTLELTPAETRLLRPGRLCPYDLERRIGTEEVTLLRGFFIVEESANDDA